MRKTRRHRVYEEGRDLGKVYEITEMPAAQAEKWGWRAFLAMSRAGVPINEDLAQQGLVGLAIVGLQTLTKANFEDLEPLLDEMMGCVQFVAPGNGQEIVRPLFPDDVEEITTRIRLRKEVFDLHAGFIFAGATSKV